MKWPKKLPLSVIFVLTLCQKSLASNNGSDSNHDTTQKVEQYGNATMFTSTIVQVQQPPSHPISTEAPELIPSTDASIISSTEDEEMPNQGQAPLKTLINSPDSNSNSTSDSNSNSTSTISPPHKSLKEQFDILNPIFFNHSFAQNKNLSLTNVSLALESPIDETFLKNLIQFFINSWYDVIDEKLVTRILDESLMAFENLPSLSQIKVPEGGKITIVGDVHGQFLDAMEIFNTFGWPSSAHYYLMNGDFVDRGHGSVEVLLVLFTMKLVYPNYFYLNRGNHEGRGITLRYGFQEMMQLKYSQSLYNHSIAVFESLPIASVVDEIAFVCHGGLPFYQGNLSAVPLEKIAKINRKRDTTGLQSINASTESIWMGHILWADPMDQNGVLPNLNRGTSVHFGPDVTRAFLKFNHLELFVRSHESHRHGYKLQHEGQCITVFSSPYYGGRKRSGALLNLYHNGRKEIQEYKRNKPTPQVYLKNDKFTA